MRRRYLVGLVIAVGYVIVAAAGQRIGAPPVRTLFDGIAPPTPYNWVSPPPELASGNKKPKPFTRTLGLGHGTGGSQAASIATSDGQATLIVQDGTFARAGAKKVRIHIAPLDPAKIGKPPSGSTYAGNAYLFEARYLPGNTEAPPRKKVTILLRYPSTGNALARRDGSTWRKLRSNTLPATLQLFADSTKLGTFVALHPGRNAKLLWLVAGIASAIAAALGLFLGFRDRRANRTSR
jgi:hypothetical protein